MTIMLKNNTSTFVLLILTFRLAKLVINKLAPIIRLVASSSTIIPLLPQCHAKIVKPKSRPKSKSQIQVPNPSPKFRSQIQSPEERDLDWGWHYNPTGHTPPSKTSMTFYDQMSIVKTWSNIRTSPVQPRSILPQIQGLTLSTPSLV